MLTVVLACAVLIALTTLIHYEVLRGLNGWLPLVNIPGRTKLLVVIFVAFAAHSVEICVYGAAIYLLGTYADVGTFRGPSEFSLVTCLYFSSETYTSLGFGDVTPIGPIRLIAGVEALNGLLLIGWSVSFCLSLHGALLEPGKGRAPELNSHTSWEFAHDHAFDGLYSRK